MINLKIDPEFQSQIPPLTDDEFKQLEENIVIVCGLWQGASYSGAHPVFCFALNLLAHGFQPHSSNISPGHRSESNPHSPADRCR